MRARRLRFVDLYRGIAVLLMIVAHVCDAFLAGRWKQGWLWGALDITFGFVAPAFLLLSGATLGLRLARAEEENAAPHSSHARLGRRLAWVLALAYWLQIPLLSLRQLIWNHPPELLARLFDSNILHVVALGGLFLLGLASLTSVSQRALRTLALTLALATITATPFVWESGVAQSVWLPLRALASPQPRATFPLLPFIAYPLFGFALTPLLLDAGRRRAVVLVSAGAALVVAGLALDAPFHALGLHDDFWRGSIPHSLFRLGGVVAALGVAMNAGLKLPARATTIEHVGQRSLAIYALHLILVYGSPMTMGARYWFDGVLDRALDPLATALAVIVVGAATSAAALLWPLFLRTAPSAGRMLWWVWWLAFAALFLLTP